MDRATLSTLVGSLVGAAAGGVGGFALSDRKKGKRFRNAVLSALAGGAAGAYAGRAGHAHFDFLKRRAAAAGSAGGDASVPGKVYFVDYPDNAIDVSQTGIPYIDAIAARLKKATGWNGTHRIGHAGILTVDGNGNGVRYDYGMYGKGPTVPEVLTSRFNLKGMDDDAIAKAMQNDVWGGKVSVYGTPVKDIGVVRRYMEGLTDKSNPAGFSVIPGGYTCSTAARNAFEAARGGVTGHLLDLLWGGYPTANAPTYGTTQAHFTKESAYDAGFSKAAEEAGVCSSGLLKLARSIIYGGMASRRRQGTDPNYTLADTVGNTWSAITSGQLPIPGVTVGSRRVSPPVTAKPGEPVYIVMSGADPGKQSQLSDGLFSRYSNDTNNNQIAYRWFDRAQATRDAVRYARAGHPVRIAGESYGGAAAADVARRMAARGIRPDMLVMYDPVSRGTVSAPTNISHKAVNIQPKYMDDWSGDSIIARVGGRHPTVSGADTVPWYGGDSDYWGPTNSAAYHWQSGYPLRHAIMGMEAADAKAHAAKPTLAAIPEKQHALPDITSAIGSKYVSALNKGS